VSKQLRITTVTTIVFSLLLTSIAYACSGRDFTARSHKHVAADQSAVKKDPCGETKADVCASVRQSMLSIQALQSPWNASTHLFAAEQLFSTEALSAEGILRPAVQLRTFFHPFLKLSLAIFYLALRI